MKMAARTVNAAATRSPKPPLCGTGVLLLADGVAELENAGHVFNESGEAGTCVI